MSGAKRQPGPSPRRLRIDESFEDAVRRALRATPRRRPADETDRRPPRNARPNGMQKKSGQK